MRRMFTALRDVQLDAPTGICAKCGDDLYGAEAEPDEWGRVYCPECRKTEENTWKTSISFPERTEHGTYSLCANDQKSRSAF